METIQVLGIAGSALLLLGVFTPIVSVPILGSVTYFMNGRGDGTIVLVLAVVSVALTLAKRYKWLWLTGLGSLGVMIFTFVNFQLEMSKAKSQMAIELRGNPFRGFADLAFQSVQLQWGWGVLLIGAGLVIAAAAMSRVNGKEADIERTLQRAEVDDGDTRKCPFCAELIKAEAKVCRFCGRELPMPAPVEPPPPADPVDLDAVRDRLLAAGPVHSAAQPIRLLCPQCQVPVTPAKPICPKCGQRVRLSRPA